ncbi:MAG: hypothetical protein NC293_11990 [Roseburia sp.]|nr:hypothetical protein [Roseburia sp.]
MPQTEEPVQTEKLTASASSTVGGEKPEEKSGKDKKRKIKSVTVIDETGKNCKLRLGDLDETDAGFGFCSSDFYRASQISDGHYYYLQTGKEGKCTIYRDKRKKVGTFFVREGYISGFAKVGKDYFARITHVEEHPVSFDIENITYDIVRIDLATQSVKVLLEDCAWDGNRGEIKINGHDIIFYKGSMYYDSRTDVQLETGRYIPGAFLMSRDLKNIELENKMICTKQMNRAKPYLTFVDGKILYGRQKGKEVSLYMFDLEMNEQTKVIKYTRHKAYDHNPPLSEDSVLISVDDDYIYCQDMAIPRKGGKMQPLLKNALRYLFGGQMFVFSSNKKYIFYLDKKYKLHRIDKKTGTDTLISDKKLMSVQCMEDRVYVKAFRHGYWDEDADKRLDILYCMSLDGTVKWKHKVKNEEDDDGDDWDC